MSKKIMCVDDSNTIRMLVKKTLVEEGFETVEAETGKDALNKLSDDISMFIVDVNMPIMDGFTFVNNIKEIEKHKRKPIIFLTTESGLEKKEKGKDMGVNGWIVKPFDPESLLKVINMLIS